MSIYYSLYTIYADHSVEIRGAVENFREAFAPHLEHTPLLNKTAQKHYNHRTGYDSRCTVVAETFWSVQAFDCNPIPSGSAEL